MMLGNPTVDVIYVVKLSNDDGDWFLDDHGSWCDRVADAWKFLHLATAEAHVAAVEARNPLGCGKVRAIVYRRQVETVATCKPVKRRRPLAVSRAASMKAARTRKRMMLARQENQ